MLRKASDVAKLLAEKYDAGFKQRGKFDYVPWPKTIRILDSIFGPENWSDEVVSTDYSYDKGIYTTVIKLSCRVADDETGEPVTFTRFGVSTSVAQATKWEREERGLVITEDPKGHETAIDGSASLARTKATKALGDAFALYLYPEDDDLPPASNGGKTYSKPASNGNGNGNGGGRWSDQPALKDVDNKEKGGLSAKQIAAVKKYGVTDEELASMTRGQAKEILDTKGASRKQAATAARVGTPDDEDDDYQF